MPVARRLVAALLMLIAALPALAQGRAARPDTPIRVGVIELTAQDVPMTLALSGLALASEDAVIRPLVQGIVQDILYRPDQQMRPGDPMFRLDPASYQAALAVARADQARAEAAVPPAQAAVDRGERLAGSNVVTRADLETARATLAQARAAVDLAAANVAAAQLNLDRTTITSPIAGRASVPSVSVGDLVTAGQADGLARVSRIDPIYADLSDSSARMLALRAMLDGGTLTRADTLDVALRLENGETISRKGRVVSIGNNVSTSTGSFTVRVEVANPEGRVWPGMFVTAQITFGQYQALLVPQRAGAPQADGSLRVWLLRDGKIARQQVTAAYSTDQDWIVTDGLSPGDRLIVDNLDNLRDGAAAEPVPVSVGPGGTVIPVAP
ncbi:efflux RND transporter periplasmic adaptor subunit [Paracoccus sp. p4-l81]|uniref:efflux RND transporter periplasmic adaptor subunit n=1 Tax=unclassified Paracoccus (in: a-proteobacteria) TaxID=2688777 RepID=UPI0035B895C7